MTDTPLRAYLMLCSANGEWSVNVCRDLGAIRLAWKEATETQSVTGVLHVGFGRPQTRVFDTVTPLWSGKVLLTEAARCALPPAFTSSRYPIAHSEGLGIYVGLQGWG